MSKIDDLLKGNAPIYTLLGLLASGGGLGILSEGAEKVEHDSVIEKFEQADYIQDVTSDNILAMINEMRIDMATMKQKLESLQ